MRGPTKVYFWVMLVYFKTECKFFDKFSQNDLTYAANILGIKKEKIDKYKPNRPTISRYKQQILKYFGFKAFDHANRKLIL